MGIIRPYVTDDDWDDDGWCIWCFQLRLHMIRNGVKEWPFLERHIAGKVWLVDHKMIQREFHFINPLYLAKGESLNRIYMRTEADLKSRLNNAELELVRLTPAIATVYAKLFPHNGYAADYLATDVEVSKILAEIDAMRYELARLKALEKK